jgi:CubicO group peptidase (beta-lactamase class C family)
MSEGPALPIASLQHHQTAAIDALFQPWEQPGSPGALVAVIRNGQIVHRKGYGLAELEHELPHTPTTRYRIASVTKHFLAVAALLLQDRGLLSLDDEIHQHLPELPDYGAPITIRQMLTMSSGIRDLGQTLWLSGVMTTTVSDGRALHELACRTPTLNFPPATEIAYCNTNYRLVQAAIERRTGKSLARVFDEEIFGPVGMGRTVLSEDQSELFPEMAGGYWFDGEGRPRRGYNGMHYSGAGGLVSCLEDLILWHEAFRTGGPFRPGLLKELETVGRLVNGRALDYGLGLAVVTYRGARTIGHGGSLPGFKTQFMRLPDHDLGVIILCNREDAQAYQLARRIADAVLGDALAPPIRPPADIDRLAGSYVDAATGYTLQVKAADGVLKATFLGAEEILEPRSDGGFRATGGHMAIELPPVPPGPVDRLEGSIGCGLAVAWERLTPIPCNEEPSETALNALTGIYRNPETDARHELAVRDGTLAIRLGLGPQPLPWMVLDPLMPDTFCFRHRHMQWAIQPSLRFQRDRDGRVTSFELSANRSRNLHFDRQE